MTSFFSDASSDPKTNAQRNLSGRTHYVDNDTLRYFHSRIVSAREFANGLLFAIISSDAQDMNNTKRGFRYVIFDIFGTVIERNPDSVDIAYFKSKARAQIARDAFLESFDAKAHTLKAIAKAKRSFALEMAKLQSKVDAKQEG